MSYSGTWESLVFGEPYLRGTIRVDIADYEGTAKITLSSQGTYQRGLVQELQASVLRTNDICQLCTRHIIFTIAQQDENSLRGYYDSTEPYDRGTFLLTLREPGSQEPLLSNPKCCILL